MKSGKNWIALARHLLLPILNRIKDDDNVVDVLNQNWPQQVRFESLAKKLKVRCLRGNVSTSDFLLLSSTPGDCCFDLTTRKLPIISTDFFMCNFFRS